MKYKKCSNFTLFLLWFFAYPIISLSQDKPTIPVHVAVSINNNPQLHSEHTTTNKNTSIQHNQTFFAMVSDFFAYAKQHRLAYKQSLQEWLRKNKYKIIRNSILGWYITIWGLLLLFHYYCNQEHAWSNWQSDTPFTDLYTKPQQLLQQELIFDIQKRYINPQNPTDFISPLADFMNKINREEKYIHYYSTLVKNLTRLYLGRFFFINEQKRKEITLRKERLAFVKKLFLSWAAEYNINQGKQKNNSTLPTS